VAPECKDGRFLTCVPSGREQDGTAEVSTRAVEPEWVHSTQKVFLVCVIASPDNKILRLSCMHKLIIVKWTYSADLALERRVTHSYAM
jgi:hypothetical protein